MSKKEKLPEMVPRVTRIKAGKKKTNGRAKSIKSNKKTDSKKPSSNKTRRRNPFSALVGYIRASFRELKFVKWPSRKDAWSMTLAVIIYSILIALIVLLFDNLYNWLFKLIIK